jgi:hypothetical protein
MLDALTPEELQFIKAIEKFKKEHNKHFLSWTEVLKVVRAAGYRKVAEPHDIPVKARQRRKAPARVSESSEASR